MKTPPNSAVGEELIISCLLFEPKLIDSIGDLKAEDFYNPTRAKIFSCIQKAYIDGLSPEHVPERVEVAGLSPALLDTFLERIPQTGRLDAQIKTVRQCAKLRTFIQVLGECQEVAYGDGEKTFEQIHGDIWEKLGPGLDISEVAGDRCELLYDTLQRVYERTEKLHAGEADLRVVKTGIYNLDTLTTGLWPSDFIIIAGRPSMGKSALAQSLTTHAVSQGYGTVLLFSLEMSRDAIAIRILSSDSGVNSTQIRNGTVSDYSFGSLANTVEKYRTLPLWVDDTPAMTVNRIRSVCRKHAQNGIALVGVDYLQLMRNTGKSRKNREQEIADYSCALKNLAREFDTPVIALSQLNRSCEMRSDKRPMMSDLRESGALEQDADGVWLLYRDDYYNPESNRAGEIEIIVAKTRNGPTGTVTALFDRHLSRFRNLGREER